MIELLVVIAVIALLVGLILPALFRARSSVVTLECSSNLRQLTAAGLAYSVDHREAYAPPRLWIWGFPRTLDFQPVNFDSPIDTEAIRLGLLFPYLNEEEAYRCPQASADGEAEFGAPLARTYSQNWTLGQHLDGVLRMDHDRRIFVPDTTSTGPTWWSPSLRASMVRGPSQLVFFAEESLWSLPREYHATPLNDGYFLAHQGDEPFGVIDPRDAFGPIHERSVDPKSLADRPASVGANLGFANAAYVDGHVGRVTYAGRFDYRDTIFTSTMLQLRDDLPNDGLPELDAAPPAPQP